MRAHCRQFNGNVNTRQAKRREREKGESDTSAAAPEEWGEKQNVDVGRGEKRDEKLKGKQRPTIDRTRSLPGTKA